jgi:Rieske Fe-S protein
MVLTPGILLNDNWNIEIIIFITNSKSPLTYVSLCQHFGCNL